MAVALRLARPRQHVLERRLPRERADEREHVAVHRGALGPGADVKQRAALGLGLGLGLPSMPAPSGEERMPRTSAHRSTGRARWTVLPPL